MPPFLKSEKQNKIYRKDDIVEEATDFYKELYTVPNQEHGGPSIYKWEEGGDTLEFLIIEVSKMLKSVKKKKKNGKVAEPDKMENDTLRILAKALVPFLTALFNQFLKEGFTTKQWHVSEIILLRKKRGQKRT